MDLSFIRQQMQLKLEEFKALNSLYLEGAQKERRVMIKYLTEDEVQKFDEILGDLKAFSSTTDEIILDIEIAIGFLVMLFQDFRKRHHAELVKESERLTFSYDGVTITREPLVFSSFALSAGYNEDLKIMDIEFASGKVYRYMNVPLDFYETIKLRRSMRGNSKELNQFEFIKLN